MCINESSFRQPIRSGDGTLRPDHVPRFGYGHLGGLC